MLCKRLTEVFIQKGTIYTSEQRLQRSHTVTVSDFRGPSGHGGAGGGGGAPGEGLPLPVSPACLLEASSRRRVVTMQHAKCKVEVSSPLP